MHSYAIGIKKSRLHIRKQVSTYISFICTLRSRQAYILYAYDTGICLISHHRYGSTLFQILAAQMKTSEILKAIIVSMSPCVLVFQRLRPHLRYGYFRRRKYISAGCILELQCGMISLLLSRRVKLVSKILVSMSRAPSSPSWWRTAMSLTRSQADSASPTEVTSRSRGLSGHRSRRMTPGRRKIGAFETNYFRWCAFLWIIHSRLSTINLHSNWDMRKVIVMSQSCIVYKLTWGINQM